jgi:hypothetical protein
MADRNASVERAARFIEPMLCLAVSDLPTGWEWVSTPDRKYISAPKQKYISWKEAMG